MSFRYSILQLDDIRMVTMEARIWSGSTEVILARDNVGHNQDRGDEDGGQSLHSRDRLAKHLMTGQLWFLREIVRG